jgi:hypothetical protein
MKKLLTLIIVAFVVIATISSCSAVLSGRNNHEGHSPAAECC